MGHRMMGKAVGLWFVKPQDVNLILRPIRELADYEGMLGQVVATEELLDQQLFEKKKTEVVLGMRDGETVGFMLFLHNSSTFLGRSGTYLEDLYVRPEYWGWGFGTAFLSRLAAIVVERGCGCLEWWYPGQNRLGIDFYLGMGTQVVSGWTVYRIDGGWLKTMAIIAQG